MCRSKMAIDVIQPTSSPSNKSKKQTSLFSSSSSNQNTTSISTSSTTNQLRKTTTTTTSSSSSFVGSSRHSLASLQSSLSENPHLYDISEIRIATNNFLAKTYSNPTSSSSTRCWRCTLHGKDVIIFQRKSQAQLRPQYVRQKLSSICRSHHVAIVNLLGASISGEHVYFVYDFIRGASFNDLLHNTKNPDFTILGSWMSRIQIATDVANGLDYIHNNTGLDVTYVHNHVKSSSVIVTEPSFNAKLCHFGVAELCGEVTEERENDDFGKDGKVIEEIIDENDDDSEKKTTSPKKLNRSNSIKFNGTRGYMPPEFQATGVGTRKSDVYAFGVILIELLSGEEPVKYKLDKATKEYRKVSAVDAAVSVVEDGGGGGGGEREGRIRKWVDRRLKDSHPVEVVEKLTRLAVDCVQVDPDKRPDMRRVAGKISKLYLESIVWCERMCLPTDFTVSFAPR